MTLLLLLSHLLMVLLAVQVVRLTSGPPPVYRSVQVSFDGLEWQVVGVLQDGKAELLDSYRTRKAAYALAYRVATNRNLPLSPS